MWWAMSFMIGIGQVKAVTLPSYTASPSAKVMVTPTLTLTPSPSLKPTTAPTILPTVTPTETTGGIPFISGRVDCKEVVIESGNETVAPAKVGVRILSRGPVKEIKSYKVDWGNETAEEGEGPYFDYTYSSPGTYEVKGYVQDKMSLTYGGSDACVKTVKILAAAPLTTQPQTGVADTAWLAIGTMLVAAAILRWQAWGRGKDAKNS